MSESWQGWNHQSLESHSEIVGNALNRFFYVGVGRFGPFWSHYSSYSTFFHFLPKLHSLSDAVQILVSFHLCACHWKWMFSISDVSDFTPANILLTLQEVKLHSHSLSSLKHHFTLVLNQNRYRPEWASPPIVRWGPLRPFILTSICHYPFPTSFLSPFFNSKNIELDL